MTLITRNFIEANGPSKLSPISTNILSCDLSIMRKVLEGHENPVGTILTLRLVNKAFAESPVLFSLLGQLRRFHIENEVAASFFFANNLARYFNALRFSQSGLEAVPLDQFTASCSGNSNVQALDISFKGCSIWPSIEKFQASAPELYDQFCHSLKGLSLCKVNSTTGSLLSLLRKTTRLESLDLSITRFSSRAYRGEIIVSDIGLGLMFLHVKKMNLSKMDISVSDLAGILLSIKTLEELTLQSYHDFDALIEALRFNLDGLLLKELKKLDIKNSTITAENLKQILSRLEQIEEINLFRIRFDRSASPINNVNLLPENLWPNRANLKKVDMRGVVLSMRDQAHIDNFFNPLQKSGVANLFC